VITVISGANEGSFPLGGRTVAFARQQLGPVYNIPADATATLNGRAASNDTVLRDGDELQFARTTAEKGSED
jgi:hypothetical protein